MVNSIIVGILVRKINSKEINPKTNKAYVLEDIKKEEYKAEVQKQLSN